MYVIYCFPVNDIIVVLVVPVGSGRGSEGWGWGWCLRWWCWEQGGAG